MPRNNDQQKGKSLRGREARNMHGRGSGKSSGKGSGRGNGGTVRLWGRHAIEAALTNPNRDAKKLWGTREAIQQLLDDNDAELPSSLPVEYAQAADLGRLVAKDAPHQGLVLEVAPLDDVALDDILDESEGRTIVVLDSVTDPHNVGAILRSCAAFDVAALVTQDRNSPLESGTLAKSASGALETVPWVRVVNLARALERMAEEGYWRVGLDGEGKASFPSALPAGPVVIVLGAEGEGLRHNVAQHCDAVARLPMASAIESLNVSNAAAIALYAVYTRAG
ncbi:23S rRNA (guanosine2251-2'-O)-methyltransferase [Novosphingobium hassiacum]|uniref:23S rRNA (Guanosine2251-2'-O)-methyltransferase n=1 Tax=Novosphingobium hassiacum TaxID=173676 RepID=A0A7W5ZS24_9SPHN|nr:23S rRNA (guanosine(2251)-2'-O)-methyltransferase RlmB [Novosphingobium hassiacum]MBB3858970.1 23S rRNA (guanosine2251-2'-O)-methyltransferase [Novosphingobium hassiacum]